MSWEQFYSKVKYLKNIEASQMLLAWDQETKMPPAAGAHRAEMQAALSACYYKELMSEEVDELLDKALDSELSTEQRFNALDWQKQRSKVLKLPKELFVKIGKEASLSQQAWSKARSNKDPSLYIPHLQMMVELQREKASCIDPSIPIYDVLLDQYEPGVSSGKVMSLLDELQKQTTPLLAEFSSASIPIPSISEEAQESFCRKIIKAIGFDMQRGRLDVSEHPFTEGLSSQDVRLTTRFKKEDFQDAIFSTLHEGGHGMYEQGLSYKDYGLAYGRAASLGVHESQSRLWENCVGRSKSFWKWALPIFNAEAATNFDFESFYKMINQVKASNIRVDADEVSYNLHICLRTKLERELLLGNISTKELEGEWNRLSKEYLGITPTSANEGFMQDVHWSVGLFGYFPTYSIGNIFSAQICANLKKQNILNESSWENGDFSSLQSWLQKNIYSHGARYSSEELSQKLFGTGLEVNSFVHYLNEKYAMG